MNLDCSMAQSYLDLVAVSIAADLVDVTGENRILAYFGIEKLNDHTRPGIKCLLDLSEFTRRLNITDIVFTIGPRINAAGRIESGRQAVELLISTDYDSAYEKAQTINKHNIERRTLDRDITEDAIKMLMDEDYDNAKKSTVLYNPHWHKGVIGIVASRLIDKFYRPTIILTSSGGHVAGSARSVKDFDIYAAIEACSDLLDQFGGHKFAAGLTMKEENVGAFIEKFEQVVAASISQKQQVQHVELDAELDLQLITPNFYNVLKQFGPFGPGNMKPVFISKNVNDRGYSKIVGENHIKLNVNQNQSGFYDAIGFQLAQHHQKISQNKPFHMCYCLEENDWNGQTTLQLNIKDIKLCEEAELLSLA